MPLLGGAVRAAHSTKLSVRHRTGLRHEAGNRV